MDLRRKYILISFMLAVTLMLASCAGDDRSAADIPASPFAGRKTVDLSGYASMSDYYGESRLVDTTVAEIDQLMKDGESFMFIAAFEDCDYCDQLMPYLNDALNEADTYAGYLDTRKDPEWLNNTDIDDYDLFVKRFGKYLEEDDSGSAHLYTPDIYVIKNGKVKAHHQGVLDDDADPAQPLSSSQEEELRETLDEMISELR